MHINKHLFEDFPYQGKKLQLQQKGFTITYWDFRGWSLRLFSCNKQEIVCWRKDFVELTKWVKGFGLVAEKNDAKCIKTIEIFMLSKFRLWVSIY